MQPDLAGAMGIEARRSPDETDRVAVDSRRRALDRLWAAFRGGPCGPVLVTGEPGAGKTWLARRFADGLPAGWRTAEVELTSALDGLDLLRLAGDPLGLELPDGLGAARLRLGAGLRDAAADGRSWLLIVDEVQRASPDAREQIEAFANQLGRPGGWSAIILLGRTELARELSTRRRTDWGSRLGLHIHLPPLDLDEARALLRTESDLSDRELEALHRDAMGNPRSMLRLARMRGRAPRPPGVEPPDAGRRVPSARPARSLAGARFRKGDEATAVGVAPAPEDEPPPPRLPSLIPARPPIRLEEGLVEVGWEGDLEAEPTRAELAPPDRPEIVPQGESGATEELVEDRYAALQAWAEWSRNRQRPPASEPELDADADALDESEGSSPGPPESSTCDPASSVRAEPPQDFAPYGQLFSRLRHSS